MSELQRFASEHGLEYRSAGALDGRFPLLRRGQRGRVAGIARGPLSCGREAAAAHWAFSEPGPSGDLQETTHTAILCEVPECAVALPWLECRSREAEMLGGSVPAPAPGMQPVRLELEFFEQRFRLLAGPGTDPAKVTELFAPKFLHAYAYEAPFGLALELIGGHLCLHVPGEMDRPGHLASFWEFAGRVAEALAREGLEDRGEA